MTDLALAYGRCEEITRREARNFFYGIRLLPAPKRAAMSALYAFARRVDDVGDGDGSTCEKLEALARIRDEIARVAAGDPPADDPVLVALADAVARFPIPVERATRGTGATQGHGRRVTGTPRGRSRRGSLPAPRASSHVEPSPSPTSSTRRAKA